MIKLVFDNFQEIKDHGVIKSNGSKDFIPSKEKGSIFIANIITK